MAADAGFMTPDGSNGKPDDKSGLAVAGQVFGLFAGIATILYVVGGIVVGLRLWYARLPTWAVVNQLPRELLITEALVYVAVPLALAAVVFASVSPFRRRIQTRPESVSDLYDWLHVMRFRIRRLYTVGAAVVIIVATVFISFRGDTFEEGYDFAAIWRFLVLALVVTALTAILSSVSVGALDLRVLADGLHQEETMTASDDSLKEWSGLRRALMHRPPRLRLIVDGALASLPLLPIFIAFGSTVPLPNVKGCALEAKYGRVGELIAHSAQTVYMGVRDDHLGQRLVVAIPMGRLEEALIASDSTDLDPDPDGPPPCDPPVPMHSRESHS